MALASRGLSELAVRHPAIARRSTDARETSRGLRPMLRLTRAASDTALPWAQIGTTRHFGRDVTNQAALVLGTGYRIGSSRDDARSFFDQPAQLLISPNWTADGQSTAAGVATILGFAGLGAIAFETKSFITKVNVHTTGGVVAVESDPITFNAGDVLRVAWAPRDGSLTVAGALTGSGDKVDRPWRWDSFSRAAVCSLGWVMVAAEPANFADAVLGEIYGDDVDLFA